MKVIIEPTTSFNSPSGVVGYYIAGAKAIVVMGDSKDMVGDANTSTDDITIKGIKEQVKFVKRGTNNNLPAEMMDKVYANNTYFKLNSFI